MFTPPPKVPVTNLDSTEVHPERTNEFIRLSYQNEGVMNRSEVDLKVATVDGLHPAGMMATHGCIDLILFSHSSPSNPSPNTICNQARIMFHCLEGEAESSDGGPMAPPPTPMREEKLSIGPALVVFHEQAQQKS